MRIWVLKLRRRRIRHSQEERNYKTLRVKHYNLLLVTIHLESRNEVVSML